MLSAEHFLITFKCLPLYRHGLVIVALAVKHNSEVVHSRECIWMLSAEHFGPERQHLPVHRRGLVVFSKDEITLGSVKEQSYFDLIVGHIIIKPQCFKHMRQIPSPNDTIFMLWIVNSL